MKTHLLKALFFFAACVMINATGSSEQASDAKLATIRYGGQLYPEEFLLKGNPEFWQKANINVEHILFSSGTEGNQALISKNIDINIGSDSKTVSLFAAVPGTIAIIAASQRGDRYSTLVRPESSYQSWYDLKGKKVGIRLGTGAEQVVRRLFEGKADLSWEDFEWVNLKVEDMPAALAGKRIEAFTAWEPTPAIAESQGIGKVLMSYGQIALVPVLIHVRKDWAASHKEEIVRFLTAHIAKVEMIRNDPERAAQIASKVASAQGAEVPPDTFKRIFKRVDFSLEVDDQVVAALKDTASFLLQLGEIKEIPEFIIDDSFLAEAKRRLGK